MLLCKNWDHAIAIKEKAKTAKSAVVIGSGYIGAEIAEQFSVTGVKTTLVDGLDRPLANNFDKTITDQVAAAFEEHGVTLALGQKVVEFRDNDDDTVTVVTEKGEYTAEMAILAVGFLPNTDLLKGKVDMLPNGAIVVDDYMQASAPACTPPATPPPCSTTPPASTITFRWPPTRCARACWWAATSRRRP